MRLFAALILLAAAACAPAADPPLTAAELEIYPEARGMPADVQGFIVQWQACQHWLGEPYGDEARRRQIERGVRRACPGIDARGRALRRRYGDRPDVLERIATLEPLGQ